MKKYNDSPIDTYKIRITILAFYILCLSIAILMCFISLIVYLSVYYQLKEVPSYYEVDKIAFNLNVNLLFVKYNLIGRYLFIFYFSTLIIFPIILCINILLEILYKPIGISKKAILYFISINLSMFLLIKYFNIFNWYIGYLLD